MRKINVFMVLFSLMFTVIYVSADTNVSYEPNKNFVFYIDDINSLAIKNIYNPSGTQIPTKFSLKDELKSKYNITIPVGNQKNLNLSDAFSILKSVETNYALKNGKYIDLSERYVDYMMSKEFYGANRSVGSIIANYDNLDFDGDTLYHDDILAFLETFGAATEEDVPYKNYSASKYNTLINAKPSVLVNSTVFLADIYNTYDNEIVNLNNNYLLENVLNNELREAWMNIMKIHIMKYGSLQNTIIGRYGFYSEDNYSYYYNPSLVHYEEQSSSKSISPTPMSIVSYDTNNYFKVSIIGWDDSYPKENFRYTPSRDGAFIALNSLGEEWGDNGYFYISYDSVDLMYRMTGVLDTKDAQTFNHYSYAENLASYSQFYPESPSSYLFGMKFTRSGENEYLTHLTIGGGFLYSDVLDKWEMTKTKFTDSNNVYHASLLSNLRKITPVDYIKTFKVYLNPIDDDFDYNKMVLLGETSSIAAGLYTNISLNEPIKISGDNYSVVIELTDKNYFRTYFSLSEDEDGNPVSGHLYSSLDFGEEWHLEESEFPLHIFTSSRANYCYKVLSTNKPIWGYYDDVDGYERVSSNVSEEQCSKLTFVDVPKTALTISSVVYISILVFTLMGITFIIYQKKNS